MAAGRLSEDQLEGTEAGAHSRLTIKRAHDGAAQTYCCRYVSPVCAQGWFFPFRAAVHTGTFIGRGGLVVGGGG